MRNLLSRLPGLRFLRGETVSKQASLPNFRDSELLMWNHLWSLMRGSKITAPYSQHAAVYRATREIARRLASVPWLIETGSAESPTVIKDDRVHSLLDNPNPEMTSSDFWEAISSYLDLRGECLGICEGRENISQFPREIWVESCDNWDRYVDPESKVITKWVQKTPSLGSNERRVLPFWQAIHFKQFNPETPYAGQSTIAAAMRTIETDGLAEALNQAYLQNGAEPGGILSTDQSLEKDQADVILEKWKDRYGGDPAKRGRPAVLHSGLKYQSISLSHADMQYLEQRRWAREDVAMVFGVPFEIMGFGQKTYDNFDTADRVMYEGVVVPRGNDIGEVMTEKLFGPATGGLLRFRFDWSKVLALQEQIGQKIDSAAKLWALGVPLEECSRVAGLKLKLERVEGSGVPWISGGLMPAGTQAQAKPFASQQVELKSLRPHGGPLTSELSSFVDRVVDVAKTDGQDEEERGRDARASEANDVIEKSMVRGEAMFRGKFSKFFLDQRADQLQRLFREASGDGREVEKAAGSRKLTMEQVRRILFSKERWDDELRMRVTLPYQTVIEAAGKQAAAQTGISFAPEDPLAAAVLKQRLLRVTDINETTRKELRDSLAQGVDSGETIQELADRVRSVYNKASHERALMIARTEAASTANQARNLVFEEAGVEKTQWVTAHDERVRHSHQMCDGKVRPLGEQFPNGLTHPGEEGAPANEVINCRCVAVPVILDRA